jgi:hypothetical protein
LEKNNLVETINADNYNNFLFGIATVEPNRAIKKCKIRKLRVEYILGISEITLTVPRSCGKCRKIEECTEDFFIQIMININENSQPATGNCGLL